MILRNSFSSVQLLGRANAVYNELIMGIRIKREEDLIMDGDQEIMGVKSGEKNCEDTQEPDYKELPNLMDGD